MEESKNKENVPQGITITTPTRQGANTLHSPAQTKSLWDSSDPMRNPPPLPLSPQMLRNSGGKTRGSTPTSPVGKLQFTAVDTTEIEYQLQKVLEAQSSLKTLLQGIDTSVKHTQLDLDNLQQRSANNNSHLKDLIENVSTTATVATPSLAIEDIEHVMLESKESLLVKLAEIETTTKGLQDGLAQVSSSLTTQTDTVLLNEIHDMKKTLAMIPTESPKDNIQTLQKTFDTHLQNNITSRDLVDSHHGELKNSIDAVQTAVSNLSIEHQVTSLKEHQTAIENEIKSQLETLSKSQSTADFEKTRSSLSAIADEIKLLREVSNKSLQTIESKPDVSEKLVSLELLVRDVMTAESMKLNDGLAGRFDKIQSSHDKVSSSIQEMHTKLTEQLNPQLQTILDSIKGVNEMLSSQANAAVSSQLDKKDLELQLKDKEIADLRSQLQEQLAKQDLTSTITELTEQKIKMETKLEGLQDIYKIRYEDLRSLCKEHEELNTRWLDFNTDKIKSITGTAAFTHMTLEESKLESPSYKKSSALGSRVLSTNSYLSNRRSTLSPKPRKVYDLSPVEGGVEE